jgi:hypothetical protein
MNPRKLKHTPFKQNMTIGEKLPGTSCTVVSPAPVEVDELLQLGSFFEALKSATRTK